MKRFGFRLQNVLNYREEIEQQRRLILARAIELVQAQERELMSCRELTSEAMEEMRQLGTRKLDLAALRQQQAHLASVRRRLTEAAERLRAAQGETESARQGFVEARKDRRALELLRAQRAADYGHEAEVQDQKELDEIGSRPWQVERPAE